MRRTVANATSAAQAAVTVIFFATFVAAVQGASVTTPAQDLAGHYRTIERAYRENRWSLLNSTVTRDFRYVEVDGTRKNVAGLERDAYAFAQQGGRITAAQLHVISLRGNGAVRLATVVVSLDVTVGRSASSHIAQLDTDRDTWRLSAGRWLLSRTDVLSEAVTRFGNPSHVTSSVRWPHQRPPDLGREYALIDRAFRESRWDLVKPFATGDARFIEVDGSAKTLDELSAAGKAFTNAGGVATSTHMLPIHVVRTNAGASVAVLASAAGTYPVGTHRVRFSQRVAQQDTWKRLDGRWRYAGGRILRQTITTFAAKSP